MGGSTSSVDTRVLYDEDLAILLNNSLYTKELIQQWHKNFLNDCPDGRLTRDRLLQSIRIYCKTDDACQFDQYVNRIFKSFDVDESGYIDFVEFLTALSITMKGNMEDKLKMAFSIYDYERNGRVTERETIRILQSMEDLMGSTGDKLSSEECRKRVIDQLFLAGGKKYATKNEFIEVCSGDPYLRKLLSTNCGFK